MQPVRILIVDDHAIIREGLTLVLEAQPDFVVVGQASKGEDVCRLAQEFRPDVIIMDVSMPGIGGAGATKRLHQLCPESRVLAFSSYDDAVYVRQLLASGAAGYLLKRSPATEIVNAVRRVAQGDMYLDSEVADKVNTSENKWSSNPGQSETLTETEEVLLRFTACGLSNKEIGSLLGLSMKTIETHKSRLMRSLDLNTRADVVQYALHQGWLEEDVSLN